MYAYSGILSALFHRERTGEGTELEVSLFDALIEWMGFPLYYTGFGGTPPPRAGTSHPAIAPYGTFAARRRHAAGAGRAERPGVGRVL